VKPRLVKTADPESGRKLGDPSPGSADFMFERTEVAAFWSINDLESNALDLWPAAVGRVAVEIVEERTA
jgi:hypothetical protein